MGAMRWFSVEAALPIEQAILARALHQLGGGFGSWFFGLAVFDQFERLHQSMPPDVADHRVLGLQFFQLAAEIFPTTSAFSSKFSSSISSMVALAATLVTGLPPNVAMLDPWNHRQFPA